MYKEKGKKIEEKYSIVVTQLEEEIASTEKHLHNLKNQRDILFQEIIQSNSVV